MQEYVKQIKQQLDGEIACFRQLLKVAESERDILLSGGHQRLMQTSEEKMALAQSLSQMQGDRRRLMEALSPDKSQPLRLRDLAGLLPPEEQAIYRRALAEAQALAERVQGVNEANKGFVAEALDTVEHLLGILSGVGLNQGYSPHGPRPAPRRPRILTRAV